MTKLGRKNRKGKDRFVLLDLGSHFAAGKLLKSTPYFVTVEVFRSGYHYRPSFSRQTIDRIFPISQSTAEFLGRYSYPYREQRA